MTQSEYIAQHGAPAAKMAGSREFAALLETGREENPFATMTAPDETSVVKLAGAAIGWAEAFKWMKNAHVQAKKPEPPAPIVKYSDPSQNFKTPNTENKKP